MKKFSLVYLFIFALAASIFFDDPRLFLYKRIIYLICVVLSVWELYLFYKKNPSDGDLALPRFYPIFMSLFLIFIAYNLVVDFLNPAFSLITMLNHPFAALAVIPVFAFRVGYQTGDVDRLVRFLFFACLACVFVTFLPIPGTSPEHEAEICCAAVLPFLVFALGRKKQLPFAVLMLLFSVYVSKATDTRTIILRDVLFLGLFAAMYFARKWYSLKFLVILIAGFFIYQFLTNLGSWLEIIKSYTHARSFDDDDTRTFLYDELFRDLKGRDLVFGRGFQGTYFSPYMLQIQSGQDFSGDSYYRFSSEVGFLQLLLKGGFIYFFLFITPLVAAIYKGLFTRHTSRIAFLLSVYILCETLILFMENLPSFHFHYFLIFFLAGYGYREAVLAKSRPVFGSRRLEDQFLTNLSTA
jgi:hypothetical protein